MTCWKKRKIPKEREKRPGNRFREYLYLGREYKSSTNFEQELIKKVIKGAGWMPWLSEAKKDVISCEKLRGGANNL